MRELHGLRTNKEIIGALIEETGEGLKEIKKEKGVERIILMDLLYRAGDSELNPKSLICIGSGGQI